MNYSATSLVISPFWQSVDEQWIGATLMALAAMILLSTTISLLRARSINMFLITVGLYVLSAMLLAPLADSQSPKMFQLWLMSPTTLTTLSMLQIIITVITVFGSIRQEAHRERAGRRLHEIRSWLIALVTVIPSPILLVFFFWIEQNMMIATRQGSPTMIGLQVAGVTVALVAMLMFILSWLHKYRLIALQMLLGLFLVTAAALLPSLTTKLSFQPAETAAMYRVPLLPGMTLALVLVAFFAFGIWWAARRCSIMMQHGVSNHATE